MSSKISALPAAITVGNADLITSVQGGVNKKVIRPIFLTAIPTETIALTGADNNVIDLLDTGEVVIQVKQGQTLLILDSSGQRFLQVDASGAVGVLTNMQDITLVNGTGAGLSLFAGGNVALTAGAGVNPSLQYVPLNPAQWSGASPTDLYSAIQRMLAVLVALNGGAIP